MVEEQDFEGLNRLQHIKDSEVIVREHCRSLPMDRVVQGEDDNQELSGATVDASLPNFAAISVVEAYCRSLPADEFLSKKPEFQVESLANGFLATCVLPPISEIAPIQGFIQKSD